MIWRLLLYLAIGAAGGFGGILALALVYDRISRKRGDGGW
jgi:hypothetical protein